MSRWTTMKKEQRETLHSILLKCIAADNTVQQIAEMFETTPDLVLDYIIQNHKAIQNAGKRKIHKDGTVWTAKQKQRLKRYGITADDYNTMYQDQQGCCKICGKHEKDQDRRLAVDHCHTSGQVRGLLCVNCNLALGLLEDDPNIMKMAIMYLEGRL